MPKRKTRTKADFARKERAAKRAGYLMSKGVPYNRKKISPESVVEAAKWKSGQYDNESMPSGMDPKMKVR